jgi:hypothetical protein
VTRPERGTALAKASLTMPRTTLLGALVIHDPEQARSIIRNKAAENDGNLVHTAEALDVSHRQLCRWTGQLGLALDLDLIRLRSGVHPGTLKGAKKLRGPRRTLAHASTHGNAPVTQAKPSATQPKPPNSDRK